MGEWRSSVAHEANASVLRLRLTRDVEGNIEASRALTKRVVRGYWRSPGVDVVGPRLPAPGFFALLYVLVKRPASVIGGGPGVTTRDFRPKPCRYCVPEEHGRQRTFNQP